MTKNNTKIKTKILAGAVALLMGTSVGVAGVATISKSAKEICAYQSNVSVSNNNFSSTSGGTPAIPSSWTGIENYSNTTSGIVNLATTEQKTINDDYCLESLPYAKDNSETTKNVLMINANNGAYYAGYQTSSATTFEKQSFYRISVEAFTFAGTQTNGSFSLTGDDKVEKLDQSVLKINGTNSAWNTYSIYLATGQFNSLSLKINLLLGQKQKASDGPIFFDNISVTRFDKETFYQTKTATNSTFVDLTENNVDFLTNANFENGMTGWSVCDDISVGKNVYADVYKIGAGFELLDVENPNAHSTQTSKALLINNLEKAHYGIKSSDFVIKQYGIYKLSFWAKANADAKATAKLVEHSPYAESIRYDAQTFTISDISKKTNNYTNDWQEYSFFVKGSPNFDQTMHLEFWLGTSETDQNGYVWFDNVTLTKITTEQFDNNSSSGTTAELYKATSSLDFANGNFDLYKVESVDQEYPFGVADWTVSNSDNGTKVGILNTAKDNRTILGTDLPLLENTIKNNVLMILNNDYKSQTVKSGTASLSADSYYQIDVYALANTNGYASVAVLCDDAIIGEQSKIATSGWTKYSFYVKTGFESKSVSVELGLGKNVGCTGYACFDRVLMTKLNDADAFENALQNKTAYSKVVDLSQIDFSNVGNQIEDEIYISNDFAGELNDGVSSTYVAGVDTTNNTLVIKSVNDEIYFSFTSNAKYALTKDDYYQFDFKIKTTGIIQNEEKTKGAKIALTGMDGIDATFKQIDTEGIEKTYSIFIKCTKDQNVNIVISLGDKNDLTQGSLSISNISINKIDQDAYQEGIKNAPETVLPIGNTDTEESDDQEKSESGSGFEFNFLYASTIITGLAIIIAVVGAVVRQYKRKHKRKVNVKKQANKSAEQSAKDVHKDDIRTINAQISKLNDKQTKLAEQINALNAEDADANKEQVEELTEQYNEIKQKLEKLNEQKKEKNKKYRQKVSQMKQDQKAENSLSKKRK